MNVNSTKKCFKKYVNNLIQMIASLHTFQIVSETEQKDDKRIMRSRFIEDAIHIDSGHYGSGYVISLSLLI